MNTHRVRLPKRIKVPHPPVSAKHHLGSYSTLTEQEYRSWFYTRWELFLRQYRLLFWFAVTMGSMAFMAALVALGIGIGSR